MLYFWVLNVLKIVEFLYEIQPKSKLSCTKDEDIWTKSHEWFNELKKKRYVIARKYSEHDQETIDLSLISSNKIDYRRMFINISILRKTRENESRSIDDKDNSRPSVFTEILIRSLTNETFIVVAEINLAAKFLPPYSYKFDIRTRVSELQHD